MRKPFCLFLLALLAGCTCNKKHTDEVADAIDTNKGASSSQSHPLKPVDSAEVILQKAKPAQVKSGVVSNKVLQLPNGWGYYIYVDDQPVIYQDVIPAVAGSEGFANDKDAQLVADYVSEKLRNNIIPPVVTKEELKTLGIKLPPEEKQ